MEVVDPAVTSFCLWLGERDGNEIPPRILVPLQSKLPVYQLNMLQHANIFPKFAILIQKPRDSSFFCIYNILQPSHSWLPILLEVRGEHTILTPSGIGEVSASPLGQGCRNILPNHLFSLSRTRNGSKKKKKKRKESEL